MTEKIKTSDKNVLKSNVNEQRKIRFNMFKMTETDKLCASKKILISLRVIAQNMQ